MFFMCCCFLKNKINLNYHCGKINYNFKFVFNPFTKNCNCLRSTIAYSIILSDHLYCACKTMFALVYRVYSQFPTQPAEVKYFEGEIIVFLLR